MLDELFGNFDPQDTFQDYLMFTPQALHRCRSPKQAAKDLKALACTLSAFWLLSLFI